MTVEVTCPRCHYKWTPPCLAIVHCLNCNGELKEYKMSIVNRNLIEVKES